MQMLTRTNNSSNCRKNKQCPKWIGRAAVCIFVTATESFHDMQKFNWYSWESMFPSKGWFIALFPYQSSACAEYRPPQHTVCFSCVYLNVYELGHLFVWYLVEFSHAIKQITLLLSQGIITRAHRVNTLLRWLHTTLMRSHLERRAGHSPGLLGRIRNLILLC